MLKRIALVGFAVAAVGVLAGTPSSWAAVDAGKIKLPKAIKYQGKTVEKGTYAVRIEDEADGPTVTLYDKNGEKLLAELAIVQETKASLKKPRASVGVVDRGGPLVRVVISHGKTRYRAYFELSD